MIIQQVIKGLSDLDDQKVDDIFQSGILCNWWRTQGQLLQGQVPDRLSEIPTPPTPAARPSDGAPEPFLPAPQHLVLPGSTQPCSGSGRYSPTGTIPGQTSSSPSRKRPMPASDRGYRGSDAPWYACVTFSASPGSAPSAVPWLTTR